MTPFALRDVNAPAPPFRWRSADGAFHNPQSMRTGHLFNTVSMIWNHAMPEEARTHDYRRYAFDERTYPAEYMKIAIKMMLPVLLGRPDLTASQLARLEFMRRLVAKRPDLLPAPSLSITRRRYPWQTT